MGRWWKRRAARGVGVRRRSQDRGTRSLAVVVEWLRSLSSASWEAHLILMCPVETVLWHLRLRLRKATSSSCGLLVVRLEFSDAVFGWRTNKGRSYRQVSITSSV